MYPWLWASYCPNAGPLRGFFPQSSPLTAGDRNRLIIFREDYDNRLCRHTKEVLAVRKQEDGIRMTQENQAWGHPVRQRMATRRGHSDTVSLESKIPDRHDR